MSLTGGTASYNQIVAIYKRLGKQWALKGNTFP